MDENNAWRFVRITVPDCIKEKRQLCIAALIISFLTVFSAASASDFSSLPRNVQASLKAGNIVQLETRPGEKPPGDKRFITVAKLITGSRSKIWEVIMDKDDAEKFIDGVLESKVVSREGNEVIIDQRTHVGGPKGSYRYLLKYRLTPEKVAAFSYIKGDIRDIQGAWWIFEGPDPARKLVVYSLHIDPGGFAPQFVVKAGMKKTMPEAMISVEKEVRRRSNP